MVDVQQAHVFTLKRIVFGDMVLNWFLGAVLSLFPATVDGLLGRTPLAPPLVYRVVGVLFLLFAAWQMLIVARGRLGAGALIFAALMALGPVVLLTVILLFMDLPLRLGWRIALWIGDVYMLFLGCWYLFLAVASRRASRS